MFWIPFTGWLSGLTKEGQRVALGYYMSRERRPTGLQTSASLAYLTESSVYENLVMARRTLPTRIDSGVVAEPAKEIKRVNAAEANFVYCHVYRSTALVLCSAMSMINLGYLLHFNLYLSKYTSLQNDLVFIRKAIIPTMQ